MNASRMRVVLFQEEGYWVAQCLEFDIAAQAKAFKDIFQELERVVVGRIIFAESKGLEAFADLPRAPRRFWDMFDAASAEIQPRTMHGSSLPDVPRPQLELRAA